MVSIIITTFKNKQNLKNALITVTNQTYDNLEIIVVDGANLQTNENVVRQFGTKIKYLEVEKEVVNWAGHKAIQHQRNIGCKKAKGEWIAMLDDDDEWDKDKIKKQVEHIHKDVSLITCWTITYTEDKEFYDRPERIIQYKDLLKNFNLSNTSSYFIRKKTLEEIGWWDEEIKGMHEYDIALKIAKKGYGIISVYKYLLIRHRNYEEQLGGIQWKIAEQLQFWRRYGFDVIKYLSLTELVIKVVNSIGLVIVYFLGFIFKNRIWNVLYPIKEMYEGKKC